MTTSKFTSKRPGTKNDRSRPPRAAGKSGAPRDGGRQPTSKSGQTFGQRSDSRPDRKSGQKFGPGSDRKSGPNDDKRSSFKSGPKSGYKSGGRSGAKPGFKSGGKFAGKSGPRPDRKAPVETVSAAGTGEGERIAKVMARAGLCSRRQAESWIIDGRVQLNGTVLTTPAVTVTGKDTVLVDGEPLPMRERTRLWLYHKPRGLVTTNKDPEGRPTVFDRLPSELPRVLTVGRLDINTEGLLLLTNDGGLARVLELPATGWLRRYRVRAFGKITQADLDTLADGIAIDGVLYGAIEATLDKEQGDNVWMTLGLREGKNREVKRVLEHLGMSVNRLIRISYGPFQLMDLGEGEVREIRGRVLRDQLGDSLAEEAGADFDAPIFHAPMPETDKRAPKSGRGAGSGERGSKGGRGFDKGEAKGQGKWLTEREGRSATGRKKTASRPDQDGPRPGKRKNEGPRREKVSPRSRFRMTSEPRFRREQEDDRPRAPQRRIWSEDGLVEDKRQEGRASKDKRDSRGGSHDGRRPPRGDRS